MAILSRKPLTWFKPDPDQPRKYFDEANLLNLGQSMKEHGQQVPVQAKPDGTIIDGERRVRAANLVGLAELDVIVTEKPLTAAELQIARLSGFFHRQGLTAPEQTDAVAELQKATGWNNKELAEHLHVDPSSITRLLATLRCIPVVLDAYRFGSLGLSDAYAISKAHKEHQQEALDLALSGATRDQLEAFVRRINQSTPVTTTKQSRCKLALPSVTVTVAGGEMDMEGLIEALQSALSAAKAANKEQQTIRTFERALRDKKGVGRGA